MGRGFWLAIAAMVTAGFIAMVFGITYGAVTSNERAVNLAHSCIQSGGTWINGSRIPNR